MQKSTKLQKYKNTKVNQQRKRKEKTYKTTQVEK